MNGRLPSPTGDWHATSARIHERVMRYAQDALAIRVARLHMPRPSDGIWPVCHGCDHEDRQIAAFWPCRTYSLIATTMLRAPDIETLLTQTKDEIRRHG